MSPDWDGASDAPTEEVMTMQALSDTDEPVAITVNNAHLLTSNEVSGPDEFPEYGTFMEALDEDGEIVYVETCRDMMAWLDLNDVSVGDTVEISGAKKDDDGFWVVATEKRQPGQNRLSEFEG